MAKLGLSRTQSKPERNTFWVNHTPKHCRRKSCKVHARFDTEQDSRDYVVKLKWTKRLADLAQAPNLAGHCITQSDHEHCDVASIMYQATSWEKPQRVEIVRRLDIDLDEVLCADWLWEYEAIATTFDRSGEDVWHFYNLRGNAENHIKEAKYGFAVDQFPSQNFAANQASQGLKLLAYNVLFTNR